MFNKENNPSSRNVKEMLRGRLRCILKRKAEDVPSNKRVQTQGCRMSSFFITQENVEIEMAKKKAVATFAAKIRLPIMRNGIYNITDRK